MGPQNQQNYPPQSPQQAHPPQPYQQSVPVVPPPQKKRSFGGLIATIVLSILLVVSLGFGVWAFMQYQDQKDNVDTITDERVNASLEIQQQELEQEFTKLNERVINTYNGPSEYGSVTFKYPRDWSVYVEKSSTSLPLSLFADPATVREDAENHGIRLTVSNRSYDSELARYERNVENGTLKTTVFKNSGQTGVRLDGELENDLVGSLVMLPLRDKTLKFWTESNGYQNVYEQALETLTFTP